MTTKARTVTVDADTWKAVCEGFDYWQAEADRLAEKNEALQEENLNLTVENALLKRLPLLTDQIIERTMPILWPQVRGHSGADARDATFDPIRAVAIDIARARLEERTKKGWSRIQLAIKVHDDLQRPSQIHRWDPHGTAKTPAVRTIEKWLKEAGLPGDASGQHKPKAVCKPR